MDNKYIKTVSLILNVFIPGIANTARNNDIAGASFIIASFIVFFIAPYIPLNLIRTLYAILVISSYSMLIRKNERRMRFRGIIVIASVFVLLSVFSLAFTHFITHDDSKDDSIKIIYVLGTKPFKIESVDKMTDMSEDDLFELFNEDIHPFFRRLKAGVDKVSEKSNTVLLISAGKNQKKIAQKILSRAKKQAVYLSCKSTKEEILKLKEFVLNEYGGKNHNARDIKIVIVSDDYHAFRVMLYSRLNDLQYVSFLATSYSDSVFSFVKRYVIEQLLFLYSYINFPLSLSIIVI